MVTTRWQSIATKAEVSATKPTTRARTAAQTKRNTTTKKGPKATNLKDVEDAEEDSEDDWEEASRKRAKRKKRSHKAASKATKARLDLATMLSMPFDIRLEIFSWLSPKDLIAVSRTNKEFRQAMMHRGATRIWKLARENDGVPAPPPAMSEPEWAVLLFDGTRCETCRAPGVLNIDFGIRRRACVGCRKANLVCTLKFKKEYPEYDEILMEMIPYTNFGGWAHGRRSSGKFFWLPDIYDISKEWAAYQDAIHRRVPGARQRAAEFLEARKQLVQSIADGTRALDSWHDSVRRSQMSENTRRQRLRKDEIYKRFSELGYQSNDIDAIRYDSLVHQSRELTERIWTRIRPILEANIQKNRQTRVTWDRMQIFKDIFSGYVKTLAPLEWRHHPSITDVMELPALKSAINAQWDVSVTKEVLEALVPQIPAAISAWREESKNALREKVVALKREIHEKANPPPKKTKKGKAPATASVDEPQTTSVDPVNLATSVFVCSRCWAASYGWGRSYANVWFGWEGVLLHSCCDMWHPRKNAQVGTPTISEQAFNLAADLVRDAGLDPETATIEDMDKIGGKWFCNTCEIKKELVHDWKSAIAHALSWNHNNTPVAWKRLTDYQLQHVQPLSQPHLRDAVWGCGRCDTNFKRRESKARVEHHLNEAHQVDSPVEGEDLIYYPSRSSYTPSNEECKVPCQPETSEDS